MYYSVLSNIVQVFFYNYFEVVWLEWTIIEKMLGEVVFHNQEDFLVVFPLDLELLICNILHITHIARTVRVIVRRCRLFIVVIFGTSWSWLILKTSQFLVLSFQQHDYNVFSLLVWFLINFYGFILAFVGAQNMVLIIYAHMQGFCVFLI